MHNFQQLENVLQLKEYVPSNQTGTVCFPSKAYKNTRVLPL